MVRLLVAHLSLVVIFLTRQEVVLWSQELPPVTHPAQTPFQVVEAAEAQSDLENVSSALQLAIYQHIHGVLSIVCFP